MIRYRLNCNKAHEFEAWFGSSAAYDRQAKKGLVECPACGSKKVTKAMMAPGVAKRGHSSEREEAAPSTAPVPAVAAEAPSAEATQRADMQRQFLDKSSK